MVGSEILSRICNIPITVFSTIQVIFHLSSTIVWLRCIGWSCWLCWLVETNGHVGGQARFFLGFTQDSSELWLGLLFFFNLQQTSNDGPDQEVIDTHNYLYHVRSKREKRAFTTSIPLYEVKVSYSWGQTTAHHHYHEAFVSLSIALCHV